MDYPRLPTGLKEAHLGRAGTMDYFYGLRPYGIRCRTGHQEIQ
jgi:hypothetical protein